MKGDNKKWVNGIDSIRFFLALIVFLSHIHNPFVDVFKASSHSILRLAGLVITPLFSGTSAVIAFFIISGFVIHYPNKGKPLNVRNFLLRRWMRIGIPLLIIGIAAVCLRLYYFIPVWSLYCELIYYTLYPLLLKIRSTWKTKFIVAFILSLIIILIFGHNDVMSFVHQNHDDTIGQYWQLGVPLTWLVGLPCWLLGVILAEQFDGLHKKISSLNLWSFRFLILTLGALIQIARFKYFTSTLLTENLFAFLLFLWLKNEFTYYKQKDSSPFFEFLGKFSYSLYLCHEMFAIILTQHFIPLTTYTYPIYILIIVFASYLVYLLIEYPSHKLAQWATKKKPLPNKQN